MTGVMFAASRLGRRMRRCFRLGIDIQDVRGLGTEGHDSCQCTLQRQSYHDQDEQKLVEFAEK
jgi:hypothetical protein